MMSEVIYVVVIETVAGWRPYGRNVFYEDFTDASGARDAAIQLGHRADVLGFARRAWVRQAGPP